ncbi:Nif3-like dinuclear metal center hexameric protein [Olleya namhaensis]|uniref:GTP cyclohydrolase 1 type 2 homolog n=1 Tax=Olleya namhaensis TaxID=1144750 RepID=A0A1I3KR49_9FLAO|nr:Nif3-like dinuclear metal center hexameric protein [Olleya namhaensis]SFI74828.1 dinuclear metal center protein, YbgI/SA1388 family [Olleya namhaensis]
MLVKDLINHLEEIAPLNYAEDFDNVGLLVGDKNTTVTNVLVALDTLEEVVDEAIAKKCNFILSFHPIIFKGLKSLTGKNYVERTVLKAIKNNIAIYAIHTALDNDNNGVNAMMCNQLNLINQRILIPQKQTIKKLTTYVPVAEAETLRTALFNAGAGQIGNYKNCSFNVNGIGTYNATEKANPVIGVIGKNHSEAETQLNITYAKHVEKSVLKALFETHSYDEVAYEVTTIENTNQNIGMGMIAELKTTQTETEFLHYLKEKMDISLIRHSKLSDRPVKKVAVLGGSGSFAINAAKAAGADAFVTSDLKYHDFFQAENAILLADIGHYESEQYTKSGLVAILTKKIPNFAFILSNTNTNPVKYF